MSNSATSLTMPEARQFGWSLRDISTSGFELHKRANGQFCVVLNHALLRGVRADMIAWWFQNFANLKVRLSGVPSYEDTEVPAYYLWHPYDHHSATLLGKTGPGGVAQAGAKIHIREAMQYDKLGWKYPVDTQLNILYVGPDGWAMGKVLSVLGPAMVLRISFKDVFEEGVHVGVHYHYEIVVGLSGSDFISRRINRKLVASYGPEFFEAWQTHNVIEVGTFENFLAPLCAQSSDPTSLHYHPDMNPVVEPTAERGGYDRNLLAARVEAYRQTDDPYQVQAFAERSFL
ncbi:MAG: hypothetical protein AAGF71_09345 [Pseudomonadota bacterium]